MLCPNCQGPMIQGFHFKNYCKNECDLKVKATGTAPETTTEKTRMYSRLGVHITEHNFPDITKRAVEIRSASMGQLEINTPDYHFQAYQNGKLINSHQIPDYMIITASSVSSLEISHYPKTVIATLK